MQRRNNKPVLQSVPIGAITLRFTPAILILICLTLIVFHRLGALPVERLQMAVTDMMSPVLSAVSKPFASAVDSVSGMTSMRSLRAENIRLTEENRKLKEWYETALKLQAENQSFRDLLNVKADPDMKFVTARVISDPGGAFVKSFLIPVGSNDNVVKGSAVMSGQGLIGRVTELGSRSARVLLITDLNSRIPVVVQNTRTRAILTGRNGDLLKLDRLPIDSGLSVGARIVTSGDGGQLPPNIPVGTIESIGPDGVLVRPLSDIDTASYVQVINTGIDTNALAVTPAP